MLFLVKIEILSSFENIFREYQHEQACTKYYILGEKYGVV